MEAIKPRVTITGITGYLGAAVCDRFLKDGGFRVCGTVRSLANQTKIASLKKGFGEEAAQLEIVEANLLDEESLRQAIAESTYVVHVASPVIFNSTDAENELIKPAVQGTLGVLKACQLAKTVKRLVITSSIAALAVPSKEDYPPNGIWDESIWTDVSASNAGGVSAYRKSKTLAERAAWDFQKDLPAEEKFDIVSINPGFIVGPSVIPTDSITYNWAKEVLLGTKQPIKARFQTFVDIRDVAYAHLAAVKVQEAANKRFILCESTMKVLDVAEMMAKDFKPKGFPVSLEESSELSLHKPIYNRAASENVLGVKYTPHREALHDQVKQMIELGIIKPTEAEQSQALSYEQLQAAFEQLQRENQNHKRENEELKVENEAQQIQIDHLEKELAETQTKLSQIELEASKKGVQIQIEANK